MARKKRSTLPNITQQDLLEQNERLRRTAHGWAWKCAYCGQFASSETLEGKYVCRSHGGVTAKQRDPVVQDAARQMGQRVPRPPGRPLHSGFYSKRAKVRVDELVEAYRSRQLDIDCTDEDLLYLRAYLGELKEQRPSLHLLEEPVQDLLKALEGHVSCQLEPDQLQQHHEIFAGIRETRLLLRQLLGYTAQLEKRHARIIRLCRVRAETRVKNRAADQLDVFAVMVQRLMAVLEEQLQPAEFEALQCRIAHDLAELPGGWWMEAAASAADLDQPHSPPSWGLSILLSPLPKPS